MDDGDCVDSDGWMLMDKGKCDGDDNGDVAGGDGDDGVGK